MKKLSRILMIVVMCGMVAACVGLTYGLANVTSRTEAEVTFSAPSGIRWNAGFGVFEVFSAAGVSHIAAGEWINTSGDVLAGSETSPGATFNKADGAATYHIMQDIAFGEARTEDPENQGSYIYSEGFNTGFNTTAYSITAGGVVDGRGFILKGFPVRNTGTLVSGSTYYGSGLFQSNAGTIKNLNITDFTYSSGNYNGFICAVNSGTITDCTTRGTSTVSVAAQRAGGIAYENTSTGRIESCINSMNITSTGSNVGGIVSAGSGTLQNCVNKGEIKGTFNIGGLVGQASGAITITGSSNCGNVEGTSSVGGIAGQTSSDATITGSSNSGKIVANYYVGGIVGYASSITITESINSGDVTGKTSGGAAGGIIGSGSNITISDCRNDGKIISYDPSVGGILGFASGYHKISNCTNNGDVDNQNSAANAKNIGGILGYAQAAADGRGVYGCVNTGKVSVANAGGSQITENYSEYNHIGGIVGFVYFSSTTVIKYTINDCTNLGAVTAAVARTFSGGILGIAFNSGAPVTTHQLKLSGCINAGDVTNSASNYTGGLIGSTYSMMMTIDSPFMLCYIDSGKNLGAVKGTSYVGGLVGHSSAETSITGSSNSGYIEGSSYIIGGLVGSGSSAITGCSNSGDVKGTYNVGGIAGSGGSAITGCSNSGNVTGTATATGDNSGKVGGIAGQAAAAITDCTNDGKITSSGPSAGGIAGWAAAYHKITNCVNNGDVVNQHGANSVKYVGGIVGYAVATAKNNDDNGVYGCANTGRITVATAGGNTLSTSSTYNHLGGIVGYAAFGSTASLAYTINDSTNTGAVTAAVDYTIAGGILGLALSSGTPSPAQQITLTGCLNTGDITNSASAYTSYTGGLAGCVFNSSGSIYSACYIDSSENRGAVIGGGVSVGGILGYVNGYHKITNCINSGDVDNLYKPAMYAAKYIGGIVGYAVTATSATGGGDNGVYGCTNTGKITVADDGGNIISSSYNYMGGIVGYVLMGNVNTSKYTIKDCTNLGQIAASVGCTIVGGILGFSYSTATLAGQSVTVTGCKNAGAITNSASDYAGGLIGCLYNNGSGQVTYYITDSENNGIITGRNSVGGLVGYAYSGGGTGNTVITLAILRSSNSGDVDGTGNIGGLVGYISCATLTLTITECSNSATVIGKGNNVGGLVGQAYAYTSVSAVNVTLSLTIAQSRNSGKVTSGVSNIGGLVGYTYANSSGTANTIKLTITESSNSSSVTGITNSVGGFVGNGYCNSSGYNIGLALAITILRSSNSGEVKGNNNVGGLVGNATCPAITLLITESSNNGSVSGNGFIGGLVGYCYGSQTGGGSGSDSTTIILTILRSNNSGNVEGTDIETNIGGLIGYTYCSLLTLKITESGNIGTINGKGNNVGGLMGYGRVTSAGNGGGGGSGELNITLTILRGSNSGKVTGDGNNVGGLVGYVTSETNCNVTVTDSVNDGDIIGKNQSVGGIIGRVGTYHKITNCINNGNVENLYDSAEAKYTGGIVGYAVVTATNNGDNGVYGCANTGKITVANAGGSAAINATSMTWNCIGGIVGYAGLGGTSSAANTNKYTIKDGTNLGTVTGNNYTNAGGILGLAYSTYTYAASGVNKQQVTLTGCLNVGDVTNSTSMYTGGLIGQVYSTATNTNSYIDGSENCGAVNGLNYAGGLAGYSRSTVTVTGSVNSGAIISVNGGRLGGLVGCAGSTATITGSSNSGMIKGGSYTGEGYIGGLVGEAASVVTITGCDNSGAVTGIHSTGGLVGCNKADATITGSVNSGKIDGGGNAVGGLVGQMASTITIKDSSNSGDVISGSSQVGGLVGSADSDTTITGSSNSGSISGTNDGIGGLVGESAGNQDFFIITGSSNRGEVNSNGYIGYLGGLVGWIKSERTNASAIITDSSNSGKICGVGTIGGFVGKADYKFTIIESSNSGEVISNFMTERDKIGGFVAWATSDLTITGSNNSGLINGDWYCGGFVAYMDSNTATLTITGSSNSGEVKSNNSYYAYCGGLVARTNSRTNIRGCSNSGKISGDSYGNSYLGGIVGFIEDYPMETKFTYCQNYGEVLVEYTTGNAGGIVGEGTGDITFTGCTNAGDITGGSEYNGTAGGIMGRGSANGGGNVNYGELVASMIYDLWQT